MMRFAAEFVRFTPEENWPEPVGRQVPVMARTPEEALEKLKRLVALGRWPEFADAVRLYMHGEEIDSYIPPMNVSSASRRWRKPNPG